MFSVAAKPSWFHADFLSQPGIRNSHTKGKCRFFNEVVSAGVIAMELQFRRVRRTFPTALLAKVLGPLLGEDSRKFSCGCNSGGHRWLVNLIVLSRRRRGPTITRRLMIRDVAPIGSSCQTQSLPFLGFAFRLRVYRDINAFRGRDKLSFSRSL